jgi:hypothetical protein
MKIEVTLVTPSKVVRFIEAVDIKDAKSIAMPIDKANLVCVRYFDGTHIVEIQKFPALGQPEFRACDFGSDENKAKNEKLLKRFKKSAYAK